ncbi:unnamed protein product [Pleuronectes platessa]|uniref:Uncharacterized protein n=1 Tax=Pleuronectes platessa TaxID=8262 RepID=A0A9N7VP72_PLEPL|nr:unnamed protein product [Pleuronectes platessa]
MDKPNSGSISFSFSLVLAWSVPSDWEEAAALIRPQVSSHSKSTPELAERYSVKNLFFIQLLILTDRSMTEHVEFTLTCHPRLPLLPTNFNLVLSLLPFLHTPVPGPALVPGSFPGSLCPASALTFQNPLPPHSRKPHSIMPETGLLSYLRLLPHKR